MKWAPHPAPLILVAIAFMGCSRGATPTEQAVSHPTGPNGSATLKKDWPKDADTWWVADKTESVKPGAITAKKQAQTTDGQVVNTRLSQPITTENVRTSKKSPAKTIAVAEDPFSTAGLYIENNSSEDLRIEITAYWNGTYHTGGDLPSKHWHEYRFPWGDYSATATASDGRSVSTSGSVEKGKRDAWYIKD